MKQLLYIDCRLPALNEMTNANRTNKFSGAKLKREYTNLVAMTCKSQKLKKIDKKIDVNFIWNCKNKRRDKDNIMAGQKFVFDGLQLAGIIKNDGWGEIGDINHRFRLADVDGVEVELVEVEQ